MKTAVALITSRDGLREGGQPNVDFCTTRLSNDAKLRRSEDLVQETYLKAYKYYDKFEEGTTSRRGSSRFEEHVHQHYRKRSSRRTRSTSRD